jgi:MFS family permease
VSFGGFVGLAGSYVIYFKSEYALTAVQAGDIVALCTFVGALLRPVGGALADRTGGIRALYFFYGIAALALVSGAVLRDYGFNVASFLIASGALGMANGAVFQLLPQRFPREIGIMTGLVGAGGGIGGFYLAYSLGMAKNFTGAYSLGFLVFAALWHPEYRLLGNDLYRHPTPVLGVAAGSAQVLRERDCHRSDGRGPPYDLSQRVGCFIHPFAYRGTGCLSAPCSLGIGRKSLRIASPAASPPRGK